jgi:ATP-dependent exoDNAse (exonuclease V) beta subunit
MNLTRAQQDAVERTGQDVCVVAGPGSGKTRVLIERFARLVETLGIAPTRILAITFTEKAANEIKERLVERFATRPDLRPSIERAWVSTIHGFCARLLSEHAIVAGLPPDFAVLDQARADRLAREAAEEALEVLFQERPGEVRRLIEALDLSTDDDGRKPDLARGLLAVYETMRVSGVESDAILPVRSMPDVWPRAYELAREILADVSTPGVHAPQLRHWAGEFLALPEAPALGHLVTARAMDQIHLHRIQRNSRARHAAAELKNDVLPRLQEQWIGAWYADSRGLLTAAIARIDGLYREKKRREASLDFADLEREAVRLLESSDAVRQETAGRFDHVLMDELQDTNRLQWRLMKLIRRNFFAVGDINQSIYGFRHADPVVFEEYRAALQTTGAAIDRLPENHRSRREILDTVSSMLDAQAGIESRPFVAARECKPTERPIVERFVGRGDQAEHVEAGMVAARIRELVDTGEFEYRHIAILVRALGSIGPFERALDRFEIPFLVSGGRTFFEARETLDLLALLAALVNPLDEIALVGVLRSPLIGMSDEELFRAGREGWQREFRKRFGKLRPLAGFVPPDRLLSMALDESGYLVGLSERARANVEKLLGHVRREHRSRPKPLAELIEDLEALRTTQSEAEAPPPDAGDVVRVMTIHASKGLEFPVVFVSALHRGTDRRKPVIAFSTETGLGVRWRNPVDGQGQSDAVHALLMDELEAREKAEENRLLYVAMTRAEDRLIFSYSERRRSSSWGKLAEAAVRIETASDRIPEPPARETQMIAGAAPSEQLLDAPAITGQHDSSASVTSIALFQACPRKYYLERYAGFAPGGGIAPQDSREVEGAGGVALGSAVHRILSGIPVPSTAGENPGESEEARELAARFEASELGRRSARAARIEREFDFLFYVEDIVLRGQMDLWFEEGGELILVDYKTDRAEAPDAYELQLRLYALALQKYAGRLPDRAVLHYLRSDRLAEVSLLPHELDAARDAVRRFLAAQEGLEFPLNPGSRCRVCSFWRNLCPGAEPEA